MKSENGDVGVGAWKASDQVKAEMIAKEGRRRRRVGRWEGEAQ